MSILTATCSPSDWMTGAAARRRLGVSYSGLQRLAILGRISTLVEPGIPPRYSRADVERIGRDGMPAASSAAAIAS